MDKGQFLSLKRRIGTAQSFALTELTKEVATLSPPIAEELILAIAKRMEQEAYVTSGAAASLIAASRNRRLYETARGHIIEDSGALITFLRAGIPDAAIEKRLRDEIYRLFCSSDILWRSQILGVLAEYGSTDCLEDLEAIDYEFTPAFQTARLATELRGTARITPEDGAEELLQAITHAADMQFGVKASRCDPRCARSRQSPCQRLGRTRARRRSLAARAFVMLASRRIVVSIPPPAQSTPLLARVRSYRSPSRRPEKSTGPVSGPGPLPTGMSVDELIAWAWKNRPANILARFGIYVTFDL